MTLPPSCYVEFVSSTATRIVDHTMGLVAQRVSVPVAFVAACNAVASAPAAHSTAAATVAAVCRDHELAAHLTEDAKALLTILGRRSMKIGGRSTHFAAARAMQDSFDAPLVTATGRGAQTFTITQRGRTVLAISKV